MATIDLRGYRVSHAFDRAGRPTRLVDANNKATTFLLDVAGQQVASIDPLLRRTTSAYDLAGRTTLRLDARGLRITSVYDAAGRRIVEQLPASLRNTFAYDPVGRRVLLSDATGRTSTTYDAKGRATVVAQPGPKRVSYVYDLADRRRYIIDPDGGRTTMVHDAAGQLTLVNAKGAGRTTLSYDLAGRQLTRQLGGAGRVTQVYDAAGQLSVVANTAGGGSVFRFTHTYDPVSRRIGVLQSSGARTTLAYDPAGQLVREWITGGPVVANATFTYDPAGNRTVANEAGVRTSSTYDVANQLLRTVAPSGRSTFTYDLAGNRARVDAASTTFYTWDVHNRLTQVNPIAGPVTSTYDGDGRRLQRQTPSQTRQFVYDFEKILQETDGTGTTQQQYASTEEQYGDLISAYGGGNSRYFANDALGSTAALLAPDGSVPDAYAYRAFGLATQTAGTIADNRYDWVGKQGYYDDLETGLYLLRARHYDPAVARFLSQDPDGFGAGDANLYRYVGNDPVNHTDPSGKAVLVPGDAVIASGCQRRDKSVALDILRDQLCWTYRDWEPREAVRLVTHKGVQRNGRAYGLANLFDTLPATIWGKVNWDQSDRPQSAAMLKSKLAKASETDQVIYPQTGWFYSNNPDLPELGKTYIDWTDVPGAPWIVVLAGWIDQLGSFLGGAISQAGDVALQGVETLAQVGIAALARVANIDLNGLLETIAKLRKVIASVGDITSAIVKDPSRFATNLLKGLYQGFVDFFDPATLWENVKTGLYGWLFGDLLDQFQKIKLPAVWDAAGLFGFVAQTLDLTAEKLKSLVKQALNAVLGGAATIAEGLIKDAEAFAGLITDASGNLDIAGAVEKIRKRAKEVLGVDVFDVGELWSAFVGQLQSWLSGTVVKAVLDWAAALVAPGVQVLKWIYVGIVWFASNIDKITALLERFLGLLGHILDLPGPLEVGQEVLGILKGALPLAFSVIAAALGVGGLTQIKNIVTGLSAKVSKWILDALIALFRKLTGRKGGAGCDTKVKGGLVAHTNATPNTNPCCSGLANSGSSTPIVNVAVNGRNVPIYGDGQSTGMISCPNGVNKHRQTSINIATTAAATGKYEYLTLNRSWSTSTGGASSDGRRPDVVGVRCDGKVNAWEAISATDDPVELRMRVNAGMATLPVSNRGLTFVVPLMC